jgi:hypothetical protein
MKNYKIQKYNKNFVGVFPRNPHETPLVLLKNWGFKRLVAYAKCNRDSYESELDLIFSTFLY